MILSELMGAPVVEGGHRLGYVSDVRFVLDLATTDASSTDAESMPQARLYGILVCPRNAESFLGYERSGVTKPWPLAHLLRHRARGSFLVLWADIAQLSSDGVQLRPDARRWSPTLRGSTSFNART